MGAPGQSDVRLVRVKEGDPLGQLWGAVKIGVNDDGTPENKDLNGDGSYCDCYDDQDVIGNGLPDFTLGWNNSITVGNLDVNLFFRGAFGHDLFNSYRGFYENLESTTIGSWNIVNTDDFDPNITKAAVNSSFVENASFVKLDNMTIGYTLPMKEGTAISKARIYLAGQNLFTLTGYSGIDPEVRYLDAEGDDPLSPGIERRNTYFTTRTISLGINLGF
jgi:iron complex outermembrane receptor protein